MKELLRKADLCTQAAERAEDVRMQLLWYANADALRKMAGERC